MPRGHHIANCLHCGKEWIVGDCVPSICPECEAAGHKGLGIDCPKCWPLDRETKMLLARMREIKKVAESIVVTDPLPTREKIDRIIQLATGGGA